MLKRVVESRHPCRTPTVVWNQCPVLLLERIALVTLSYRFLMTRIRLALMLYFFMVAKKLLPNPVEGIFEAYECMVEVLLVLEISLTEDS